MKTSLKVITIVIAASTGKYNAQNTFPPSGNVGIGTTMPEYKLDVPSGTTRFGGDVTLNARLYIGGPAEKATIKYIPATAVFPAMLKFSAPEGSRPFGMGTGGGSAEDDSTPDLTCLNGENAHTPGFLNTFSQALSVTYNPTTAVNPGGQIIMAHNGVNALIETQGTGANAPTANHPGDLFINSRCNRNVLFFTHDVPFGAGQTAIMSVAGDVNIKGHLQLGDNSSTVFTDPGSKLYVYNAVNTVQNAIRIKHGANSKLGIKIISFNNAPAFAVNSSPNSVSEGAEVFKIEGNGGTTITTANTNAFSVVDPSNSQVNFRVLKTGETAIKAQNTDALLVYNVNNSVNFRVKSNGETSIKALSTEAFNITDASGAINFKVKSNGEAYARFIKVMLGNFPDYVFAKEYQLMGLKELEQYIRTNNHLPDVPTAADIQRDGADLGELARIQMQKIEELTLYIIELKKELDATREEIGKLGR